MPKAKLIKVAGTTVQLPGGGPAVEPTIRQRCTTRYSGFVDLDSLYGAPPISHEIDVTISQHVLEMEDEDAWKRLAASFEVEKSRDEEWVTIASAWVDEFPARFYWDLKTTWFEWLDSMDGDLATVGELADDLMERGDSMALLSGSLLYVRSVDVHPAFSGQQIGARLVAHSFWSLSRSDSDVAMLLAKPMKGRFRLREPDCSATAIRQIAGYYRRMGFERSQPRERFRDGGAVLMHAPIGEFTLPFRGLGGMVRTSDAPGPSTLICETLSSHLHRLLDLRSLSVLYSYLVSSDQLGNPVVPHQENPAGGIHSHQQACDSLRGWVIRHVEPIQIREVSSELVPFQACQGKLATRPFQPR